MKSLNVKKNYLPQNILLLLKVFLLYIVLSIAIRFVFTLTNISTEIPFSTYYRAFHFDVCVFAYLISFPTILMLINEFLQSTILNSVTKRFIQLFLLIALLISIADIPYFKQFGNHINRNAFLWDQSNGFMLKLLFQNSSYWFYLLAFILSAVFVVIIVNKWFKQVEFTKHNKIKLLVTYIFLFCLLGISMRGRITNINMLNEDYAIVSNNASVNQIAINANFSFWRTVIFNNQKKYVPSLDIKKDIDDIRNYLGLEPNGSLNIDRKIHKSDSLPSKPNVVLVIMESMSVFKMGYYGGKNSTPNLNSLVKESVFCNNFFSSGVHTFNGLFSSTTGFPAIYTEHSLREYVKQPYESLGNTLKNLGYTTSFYTGGDKDFDNTKGFFTINGFENFISQDDFNSSDIISVMGVADHLLFKKAIDDAKQCKEPFLKVIMTSSDHGPWAIPDDIKLKEFGSNQSENSTIYADWSIGQFITEAKKQNWYKNTVFVFVGDHGLAMGHTYEMPISYNHVPCVIHFPKQLKTDTINSPCYQEDIFPTIMYLVNQNYTNNTFGINILKEKHPYVVFSADDKLGCVDNEGFYYYETLSNDKKYLRKYQNLDTTNYIHIYKSKADSLSKNIKTIYEGAQYFNYMKYKLYN